jgi:hypothetical protein
LEGENVIKAWQWLKGWRARRRFRRALWKDWRAYRAMIDRHTQARGEFEFMAERLGVQVGAFDPWTPALEIVKRLQEARRDLRNGEQMYAEMRDRCVRAEAGLERVRAAGSTNHGAWPVPGLTAGEIERLALLVEEMGESLQATGKVLRHGWQSFSPFDTQQRTNRSALERELGDMRAAVNLMCDAGDLKQRNIGSYSAAKMARIFRWTHHQVVNQQQATGGERG